MRRRPAALLLSLLLLAGVAVASPADAAGARETKYLQRVLVLVNAARAEARTCGSTPMPAVKPLKRAVRIDRVADAYAGLMAREDFFSHTAPDGSTMVDRMHGAGFRGTIGENIAAGYGTPAAVVKGWLHSPGHCANLMNGSFHRVGLGLATSSSAAYGTYWVQDFSS